MKQLSLATEPGWTNRTAQHRSVLQVHELTHALRGALEVQFADVWVEGEISNFKRHASGHLYFSLKDADAQLHCVMWRAFTNYLFFTPQDGLTVRAHGEITLYERRGELQLSVRSLQPVGEGALRQAFERLKLKLQEEGLFDPLHKKPLPRFPECIGIVTSGSGAALQDMLTVLRRRYPLARVLVCPVQVQGPGAAEQIAAAVETFDAQADPEGEPGFLPDVLIVGRGGGSAEDLWAFNEEIVARALFACRIPVISAVGHEVDYTIADYVADVRAATPSMAAELAVPDTAALESQVLEQHAALEAGIHRILQEREQQIRSLVRSHAFNRPVDQLHTLSERVRGWHDRLVRAGSRLTERERNRLESLAGRLRSLDPKRVHPDAVAIERNGIRMISAAALEEGEEVTLRFPDGTRRARIIG